MSKCDKQALALVGIGNTIAGDDAAGIVALEYLQKALSGNPSLYFLTLEADLFEISDHLSRANHFIFIDAVAGNEPGQILRSRQIPRAYTPSFHQADIGAVMASLEKLTFVEPFPSWEVWGITIAPPTEFRTGLREPIESAAKMVAVLLASHVKEIHERYGSFL